MQRIGIGVLQSVVIIGFVCLGIYSIHFLFIMGVDAAQEKTLVTQCQEYAKAKNVSFVKAVNAFTYEENTGHAVCLINDLYERYVFIDDALQLLVSRNAQSYQTVADFNPLDPKQSYSLALYQDEPVYVYRKFDEDSLLIAYYRFDTGKLLFVLTDEE